MKPNITAFDRLHQVGVLSFPARFGGLDGRAGSSVSAFCLADSRDHGRTAKEVMGEMMRLREGIFPVQAEDFPRVMEVWEASVRETHHFLTDADIQFLKPLVPEGLHHVPHLVCVRDEGGQVAGFAGVADGKLEALFVHPSWRGKGIGRRLLQHAVNSLGATTLDVNEQNDQAVGFYLRMGFEVAGRSELDSMGQPFPLLHLRARDAQEGEASDEPQ
jgi:putative acetyltransferase